jgi:hypothetical protein
MARSAVLEVPAEGARVSGISFASGWKCPPVGEITVQFDDGQPLAAATRLPRGDTAEMCQNDGANGYLIQFNFNLLGLGEHRVRVFDDGLEFASARFHVTEFGVPFLRDAEGSFLVMNFPEAGRAAMIDWNQSTQGFEIVERIGSEDYHLQTLLSEERGECFEGNAATPAAVLGGASFMAPCGGSSGQSWHFKPLGPGTFQLQTIMSEGRGECLKGNVVSAEAPLGGAVAMAACSNRSDQLWRVLPVGDGRFQLQTVASGRNDECLEGNAVDEGAFLGGASFMAPCGCFTGQIWKLVRE